MTGDDKRGRGFSEKRTHPRHKVSKDVRVEVDGEVVVGEAKNISLCGVAVNSLVEMTTEQFVKLHLGQLGELEAHVVRQTEEGFAVEFEKVKDNGSVLEAKIKSMLGNADEKDNGDEFAEERRRMEAQLMKMFDDD